LATIWLEIQFGKYGRKRKINEELEPEIEGLVVGVGKSEFLL
jgi:hypothetical protein